MKVLFIQKEGGIFGAENYHLHIIPALIRSGIHIDFLRLYTDYQLGIDSDFVKRLQQMQVHVMQVNIGRIPGVSDIRAVIRTIREGHYDIVHSHLIHGDLYTAISKSFIRGRTKFVSTKHGYDNNFTAKFGFDASRQTKTPYFLISRWAESKFDGSSTISRGLLNFFRATGLTSGHKMKLIYYGFDFEDVKEAESLEQYRLAPQQICIAGRLVAFKGHLWAIEAVDILRKTFPKLKLVIAGTGNFETVLRSKVTDLKLEDNVVFLGYRKDVSQWMKYSDVVLVTSRAEGFGVVFLEAFNAKTPVVAFDVPAANELIVNQESGALAKPYDVHDLAKQIITLLQNEQTGKMYAARSYTRLKNDFALKNMVDETIQWYKTVMNS